LAPSDPTLIFVSEHRVTEQEGWITLGEGPLTIAKLLCPSAHVIAAGVAENVIHSIALGDILSVLTDNESELCFVVGCLILDKLGNIDLLGIGPVERCSGFDQEDWVRRDRHVGFLGVIVVVEP
jgi:hypothetical protein